MKNYLLIALLLSINSLSAFAAPSLCSSAISPQILSQDTKLDPSFNYVFRTSTPKSIISITSAKTNRAFNKLINETIVDIFSLPSGALFCSFLDNSTSEDSRLRSANYILGTDYEASKKIIKRCLPFIKKENSRKIFGLSTQGKHYILIETAEQMNLDSWSTKFNETIFFINPKNLNKIHLALLLTHEIAISLDQKNASDIFWYEDRLSKDVTPVNQDQKCPFLEAMNMPYLKTALATIRAIATERLIMSEISSQCKIEVDPFYNNFFHQACESQVKEVIEKEKMIRPAISLYKGMYFLLPQIATGCFKENQNDDKYHPYSKDLSAFLVSPTGEASQALQDLMEQDIAESFEKLLSTQFISKQDDKKRIEACHYMTTPQFGSIMNPINDGPRPRITGGW